MERDDQPLQGAVEFDFLTHGMRDLQHMRATVGPERAGDGIDQLIGHLLADDPDRDGSDGFDVLILAGIGAFGNHACGEELIILHQVLTDIGCDRQQADRQKADWGQEDWVTAWLRSLIYRPRVYRPRVYQIQAGCRHPVVSYTVRYQEQAGT